MPEKIKQRMPLERVAEEQDRRNNAEPASSSKPDEAIAATRRRVRVLIAKPALDGHDSDMIMLAKAFRDAGMEVIYAGLLPTAEDVARIAVDEDVDAVALSLHNGAHLAAFLEVKKLLEKSGAKDIQVVGNGKIPLEDKKKLEAKGITGNFGPEVPVESIIERIKKAAGRKWEME